MGHLANNSIYKLLKSKKYDKLHKLADMAELADALDLGSSTFGVQVRFLLSARSNEKCIKKEKDTPRGRLRIRRSVFFFFCPRREPWA